MSPPVPSAVSLDQLNAADEAAFVAAIGDTFEHAPWVAGEVFARRPFASLAALYDAMAAVVRSLPEERRRALINGHPELAGKAARARDMTTDSIAEQSSAGLDRLSEPEFARFTELNAAYRKTFGFPFMICVRRHTKDSILREFERRLLQNATAERETALTEILRVVAFRLDQRVQAADRLKVHGRLSTHVLDTTTGRPAAGIPVQLFERSETEAPRLLAEAVTNVDGRTDAPLISERPIPIGRYELVFRVGDYFAGQGAPAASPAFLDSVPIRFAVAEPEGHYHVPLLVTPWGYTTYRGS